MCSNQIRIKELKSIYHNIKEVIKNRLKEFKDVFIFGKDEDIFAELVFCILTPQSKAFICWNTVEELKVKGLLFKDNKEEIVSVLKKVRFKNKKAQYIIEAQKFFIKTPFKSKILEFKNIFKAREWLITNIKGIGYKEASHFLRNIGMGENIAILDRHILKNLNTFGVIDRIPLAIYKNEYIEIENKMKDFSNRINIPISHLDLLFWYKETGVIFK